MKNFSFKLPSKYVLLLDDLVRKGIFVSRGEAIRIALEDFIRERFNEIIES